MNRPQSLGILLLIFFSLGCSAQDFKSDILKTLQKQQDCWNNGDIDCFMKGYWEDEGLRFMGKNGVTAGYLATLNRYKKVYPDAEAMGQLDFDIQAVDRLSRKYALVIGKWHLERTDDELEGYFSLLWKKKRGTWVIILDHSS